MHALLILVLAAKGIAEEIETSMMLYIAPESVDMKKAVKDYHGNKPGGLTRDPNGNGTYSPTGVWGDATLATREKGKIVVEALVKSVLEEIEELRKSDWWQPATLHLGGGVSESNQPFDASAPKQRF